MQEEKTNVKLGFCQKEFPKFLFWNFEKKKSPSVQNEIRFYLKKSKKKVLKKML